MLKCHGATRAILLTLAVFLFAALALMAQTPAAPAQAATVAPAQTAVTPATTAVSPEIKALLNKVIATYGGMDKIKSIKNMRITVDMLAKTQQGDMQMTGEIVVVPPDHESVSLTMSMGQIHLVFAPEASFQAFGENIQDLPQEAGASAIEEMSHNDFGVVKHIDDPAYSFVLNGEETVSGVKTKVLAITLRGNTFTWYIDPETGHILRTDDVTFDQNGPAKVSNYLSEWKTISGVDTATHIVTWQNGEIARTMDVKNVEFNVTVDPAIFKKP